jgi:hypothetical protein
VVISVLHPHEDLDDINSAMRQCGTIHASKELHRLYVCLQRVGSDVWRRVFSPSTLRDLAARFGLLKLNLDLVTQQDGRRSRPVSLVGSAKRVGAVKAWAEYRGIGVGAAVLELAQAADIMNRRQYHVLLHEVDPSASDGEGLRPASPKSRAMFRRLGDQWEISFDDQHVHLSDSAGMRRIARLLSQPETSIGSTALMGVATDMSKSVDFGRDEVLDDRALRELRRRLEQAQQELAEAHRDADPAALAEAADEIDNIESEIRRSTGLMGKSRVLGAPPPAAQATSAVRKSITRAISSIAAAGASRAAEHFEGSITRDGNIFRYDPRPPAPMWSL